MRTLCFRMDGFIVCEEHREILQAAWQEEQANTEKREEEKREKRVLGYWKRLTRGLIIKQQMKYKFNLVVSESGQKTPV